MFCVCALFIHLNNSLLNKNENWDKNWNEVEYIPTAANFIIFCENECAQVMAI